MLKVHIKKKVGNFCLNIDMETENGCLGILGASGCGKSMLLKCIAGIETPDEGSIILNDHILFDSKQKINEVPQKRKVGYLFQNYALFPTMSVLQNIMTGINVKDKKQKREIAMAYVQKFELEGLENHLPSQLSGGQQQRTAIARMLAAKPNLILLDEPFSALDSHLKETMQQEMMRVIEEFEGSVLLVSHSRDEIYRMAPKLALMNQGRFLLIDDTKKAFENPRYVQAGRLTGCKNISPVNKVDDTHVLALDWGITLTLKKPIGDEVSHVGIRAHYFEPVIDNQKENTFDFNIEEVIETPFEKQYMLYAVDVQGNDQMHMKPLIWMVSKQNDLNDMEEKVKLYIDHKNLMLLREDK